MAAKVSIEIVGASLEANLLANLARRRINSLKMAQGTVAKIERDRQIYGSAAAEREKLLTIMNDGLHRIASRTLDEIYKLIPSI